MFSCLDTIFLFPFAKRGVSTTFPIFLFSNSFLCQLFFSLFRRVPSTLSTLPQKSTNGFSRGLSGARGRRRGWQLAQNGLYPSIARIIRLFVSWFIRPTARSIYEFIGSMTTCTTHSKHVPSDAVITFTIG
ncbi:hypothetical protein L5515_014076 [Caenorhabditis briggsae]|uniref:Uncharacterized protein n=1 Tax=Caenorhabditis briggsae TaxID=6238 RepID=A0AAE9EAP5_CAEBR|nr:hypothetical protein L5515_014076 [Caenorhabditis briggsae]